MLELNPELERYIEAHSEPESDVLVELSRETHLNVLRPRMLSGNLQGQFLRMICQMIGARRVLEIGTYTGYAAIAMASGMGEDGVLHTIDVNDELEDFTRRYIGKSGLQERIVFHVGDACEIIPRLDEMFDLVFIDADKREYSEYYRLVFDKVRSGGIIIADDVLWDGKVADPQVKLDAQTKGILDFNDMVQADQRVTNLLLPVRHGLMIVRKK
ncbi:O-methyltransferase [Butyricimonas paravirosa]|mgnify:FL=1|uniref:O-methyltransferase n=1 Tax=Butyricimonas paravirosa TaxID=1472417 RepID=UPI00210A1705|nr:O-methyltransferase [Butyricimonas paravirosa]MCQ4872013.1 O-methyltransferase [Butyricimonas paravirosa]